MNKKGFTLIEMVVSVFIITVAVVSIVQATTKHIQQTKFEKEAYVAALLGQEGIEIIKNIRDTNWVISSSWDTGLTSCASGCQADYDDVSLSAYSSSSYLYIEGSTKFYKYIVSPLAADTKTIYTRKITIDTGTTDVLKITVDVYWRGNTTTVKEDIYNWKQ
jgi:prepilin-type N-terminal cleavage/methylation domain-containing protein